MTRQRDDAHAQGVSMTTPRAGQAGPKVSATDISVFYGDKQALFDVSLDMPDQIGRAHV